MIFVHLRPAVPLHSVLVVGSASLEDWLVNPSTSSNTSNHGTVGRGDHLDSIDASHTKDTSNDLFTFFEPDGSLTLVLLVSGLWAITVA